MCFRSDHRRDLSAALRCHITWFTILGSIGTIQNISSGLSTLLRQLGVKCIRQHCKHDIVDVLECRPTDCCMLDSALDVLYIVTTLHHTRTQIKRTGI